MTLRERLEAMCPSCGKSDPEDRTFCPSTPDKCGGCETCEDDFHSPSTTTASAPPSAAREAEGESNVRPDER